MRILRVAQKIYPDVKGGGPYHVHAMSRDQAAMGHDVTVVTVRTDPNLPHIEERDGYTVVRYDPTVTLLGNEISLGLARYLSSADDFDVIHAHSHLYFSTNLAALKHFLGDIPLAITNHGLYSQNASEWVFDLYLRSIGRWTFNQADVVFCYTEADRDRLQTRSVNSPIKVVSNGIDTERFKPEGSTSELIDAEGPVVLFVGRLVEGKRPEVAIEAFAEVHESLPDAELYLCGEGSLQTELTKLAAELRIREAVTFLGQVPYEKMPSVYRGADVLVLPSRAEGVPRTIMEALASEVSVVSSDLSQVRSAFGDSVRYVDGENAVALGSKIITVIINKNVHKLDNQFQWTQTVADTTAGLKQIVRSQSI